MRRCSRCEEIKDEDQFYTCGSKPGGYTSHCKSCFLALQAIRLRRNRERPTTEIERRPDVLRKCCGCKRLLPETEFHINRQTKQGLSARCRECASHKLRRYRGAKITRDEYETILAAQGGHCALCDKVRETSGRSLSVDHDHKTGKVRGILCVLHNTLLGSAEDSIEILQSAIAYLEKCR